MVEWALKDVVTIKIMKMGLEGFKKQLRQSFKNSMRWVVLEVSRGGYLLGWRCFAGYAPAATYAGLSRVAGSLKILKTMTSVLKLLFKVRYDPWSPEKLKVIEEVLAEPHGLAGNRALFNSQSFLLGDYFPMKWKTVTRMADISYTYSMATGSIDRDGVFRPSRFFDQTFETPYEILQRPALLSAEDFDGLDGIVTVGIFAELVPEIVDLVGKSRLLFRTNLCSSDGQVDQGDVVEVCDPFKSFEHNCTVIVKCSLETENVSFFDRQLRPGKLSLTICLPSQCRWNQEPIYFIER